VILGERSAEQWAERATDRYKMERVRPLADLVRGLERLSLVAEQLVMALGPTPATGVRLALPR
jgi:hypothetical protein